MCSPSSMRCAGMTICFFIMSANAITAPSGSRFMTSSMILWYAISCRPSSAAIKPQIFASCSSPVLERESRGVPVRDLRRPLLERRVHEPQVRVVLRLRVHPGADEVLNRRLDRLHVHLAGEVEVLVHEVSVAVLLRGPHPRPLPPRGRVRARLILRPFQRVEHVHVRRKRLLGDHVADEDDEVVVREGARAL